jgi:glycosyltransferase involved in cell wall biosynthesis
MTEGIQEDMKTELISVIIPVYKVEKYINRCVESVLVQNYHNIEVILVDDGSPDNCGIICDRYADKDSRVKVIHKTNGGLSDARNAGLNIATGQYICFIDSDDYIEKDMLKDMYDNIVRTGADITICNYCAVDNEGHKQYFRWRVDRKRILEEFL